MNLYVQETGTQNDTTILFLHGLGVSGWMWHDQVETLQEDYHCLNVDLPGNGESYQTEWLSFADTVDQLAMLIEERARGGRAHVVGLSLGGYTAIHLLQRHPERVSSMVISGVTTRPFDKARLVQMVVPILAKAMKWDFVINMSAKAMQFPPDVVPLYRRDSKRVSPEGFQRVYAEVLNYQLPDELSQRPHPVLVVAGDSEAKMVLRHLGDVPDLLPNSVAYIAPQAHHGWNGEHPELFTAMIQAWVEQTPLPPALIAHNAAPRQTPIAATP